MRRGQCRNQPRNMHRWLTRYPSPGRRIVVAWVKLRNVFKCSSSSEHLKLTKQTKQKVTGYARRHFGLPFCIQLVRGTLRGQGKKQERSPRGGISCVGTIARKLQYICIQEIVQLSLGTRAAGELYSPSTFVRW